MVSDADLVRNYLDAVWVGRDPSAVARFVAPTYRRHLGTTSPPLDAAGQIERVTAFQASFPDATVTLEDLVAADGFVTFRSTLRGTHLGPVLGIEATGRSVVVGLLDLFRVEDGRIVEHWGGPDLLDLAHQLGAQLTHPAQEPTP